MATHYRLDENGDLHLAGIGNHHSNYDADTEEGAEPKKVRRKMCKSDTWKRTTTSKHYNSGKGRRQRGIEDPRAVKGEF